MAKARKMSRFIIGWSCSVKFYRLLIQKNILSIKSPFVYQHRHSFHVLNSAVKQCFNINIVWNWVLNIDFQRNVTVSNTLQFVSMKINVCCIQSTNIIECISIGENIKIAGFCLSSRPWSCVNCCLYNQKFTREEY